LASKIQAPKLPAILYRERLVRLVRNISEKTVITVTAGAGYGKTSLIADALSRMEINTAWVRLDPQDTDFPVFMTALKSSILKILPAFSLNLSAPLKKPSKKKLQLFWMIITWSRTIKPSMVRLNL